jgi:hypothetical protein
MKFSRAISTLRTRTEKSSKRWFFHHSTNWPGWQPERTLLYSVAGKATDLTYKTLLCNLIHRVYLTHEVWMRGSYNTWHYFTHLKQQKSLSLYVHGYKATFCSVQLQYFLLLHSHRTFTHFLNLICTPWHLKFLSLSTTLVNCRDYIISNGKE